MNATHLPAGRFFSASPLSPQPVEPEPNSPGPALAPPSDPKRRGRGWIAVLVVALLAVAGLTWFLGNRGAQPASPGAALRTAVVGPAALEPTLRVGGAITAKNYSAIRAPRMRGPRDAGRQTLTLMNLAEPGSIVEAGALIAEFELKWLEDHIDDQRSALVQAKSNVDKRRAELMILEETERQAAATSKGDHGKAALDLRTIEVRSAIEGEVLKLNEQETEAAYKQLEEQLTLRRIANEADLAKLKITVQESRLHLERHERDHEKMRVTSPLAGLVVMEPMYKGGGQFQQTSSGDQVYPGALFMRVVDLSEMIVSASVNQVDVQSVRIGQKALVRLDAYPDLRLEGRVIGIGAMATSGGGRFNRGSSGLFLKQIPIQIAISSDDDRVIPDLSASADILLNHFEADVVAPREAIRRDGERTFVYVRNGDDFAERDVELGELTATTVAVVSGLSSGDEVLLSKPPSTS